MGAFDHLSDDDPRVIEHERRQNQKTCNQCSADKPNFKTIYAIHCATGCSCCSGESNHWQGFYNSLDEAQEAINNFKKSPPESTKWFTVYKLRAEVISDNRFVVGNRVFEDYLHDSFLEYDRSLSGYDLAGEIVGGTQKS